VVPYLDELLFQQTSNPRTGIDRPATQNKQFLHFAEGETKLLHLPNEPYAVDVLSTEKTKAAAGSRWSSQKPFFFVEP